MTRRAEAGLILAAAILAAIGVGIVEFTRGNWLDAQVAVTLISFLMAFSSWHSVACTWPSGDGLPGHRASYFR
jgi:hypothetical protein